jgi:hypothetical protein
LPFFLIGIVLALFDQNLGYLLIFLSIFYGASNNADYQRGTDFVLDKIDEMICAKELQQDFLTGDKKPAFYKGPMPGNPDQAKTIMPSMLGYDAPVTPK